MDRQAGLERWVKGLSGSERRPNFVLIVTDQQRADSIGCYGNPVTRTPHIDGLARRGSRFDRCYVASPVCMPNRASIMTGRMPSAHRVRMNGIPLPLQEMTFVESLRRDGYSTALIGKSHLQNMIDLPPKVKPAGGASGRASGEALSGVGGEGYGEELPARWRSDEPLRVQTPFYGFEHVTLCTGHGDLVGGHWYQWMRSIGCEPDRLAGAEHALQTTSRCPQAWRTRVPEELYPTRFIENETVAWIRDHARNRSDTPFFLTVSFPDPHHPFTPPGRYWDMYRPEDQVLPGSFHCADDVLPQVRWARAQRRKDPDRAAQGYGAFAVDEREARVAMALTGGMVTMIDDAVGRILSALSENGLSEETIVAFTSDHGDYMGDHGLLLKGPLHLHSLLQVPLIWFDPRMPHREAVIDGLHSSIDISATVLSTAGIDPYNGLQGRSFVETLKGSRGASRTLLIEEDAQDAHFGFQSAPRIRTLLTERYRLSVYGRSGHAELFDLQEDPHELVNRWACSGYSRVRAQLTEELALVEMEAADTSPWPVFMA